MVVRPALTASVVEALEADGFLLGTPANIGYISGALKHFFDTVYYPCLEATKGRPYAAYLHGNLGTEGAQRAIEAITAGLQWRAVAPILSIAGSPTKADRRSALRARWHGCRKPHVSRRSGIISGPAAGRPSEAAMPARSPHPLLVIDDRPRVVAGLR